MYASLNAYEFALKDHDSAFGKIYAPDIHVIAILTYWMAPLRSISVDSSKFSTSKFRSRALEELCIYVEIESGWAEVSALRLNRHVLDMLTCLFVESKLARVAKYTSKTGAVYKPRVFLSIRSHHIITGQ